MDILGSGKYKKVVYKEFTMSVTCLSKHYQIVTKALVSMANE